MKVNILSSTKKILQSDKVKGLRVPTLNGQVGIYEGHVGMVSALGLGELVVKYLDADQPERRMAVSGGFISVKNDIVEVLCDDAVMEDEIVIAEIEKAEKMAEEKISSKIPPAELVQLEKQLRFERFKKDMASK